MYSIIISPKAKKELKLFPLRYKQTIRDVIYEIKENPLSGKALARELTGKYSYKVGVYRIIYKINKRDKKIYILTAGHRGIIYS